MIAHAVSGTGMYHPLERVLGRRYGGFILCYHNLTPERFTEHVEALAPNRPISLSEILEREAQGKPTGGLFAITFDDGVGETVRTISRTCRQRQWPVTFYVPTAYLDDPLAMPFQWLNNLKSHLPQRVIDLPSRRVDLSAPGAPAHFHRTLKHIMYTRPRDEYVPIIKEVVAFLIDTGLVARDELTPPAPISWDEVTELSKDPLIRFESHGVSHCAVTACTPSELEREYRESRDKIQEHTGLPCEHFCYPFGGSQSIGTTAPTVAAQFYKSAVTGARGRLRDMQPFLVPRIPVYPKDDGAVARLKVLTG
jgi:peptidoglycan/xylan/chitin deacetylase (PgdA/CDA1 family)